jgi:hypothetical protein
MESTYRYAVQHYWRCPLSQLYMWLNANVVHAKIGHRRRTGTVLAELNGSNEVLPCGLTVGDVFEGMRGEQLIMEMVPPCKGAYVRRKKGRGQIVLVLG